MSYKTNNGLDNPSFELSTGDVNISGSDLTIKSVTNELENPENRAQWGNGVEFLMSCIAMSVGLGNIWRFPFTAYENGGGAFLIPYIIVLLVIGRPLYYLEMSLGQFSSRGNVKMFESICPALKGVGYGQLIAGAVVATYYCSLMAVTIFYFVNSFTSELPWSQCRPEWGINNTTCIASILKGNISISKNAISSSELYYTREVLKEKYDISDGIGLPEWRLTLCLFISWVLTFLVSCRGVSSSGKAAYFLAIFPYIVMVALLIRAVTLDGSIEGMMYFIKPDWTKLLTAQVWYAAVTQCFFSLGVGFGTITMYSSYNKFDHNINRDAMVVTSIDTLTSLLAGSTIFGILGNLAYELNVDVKDVIKSGGSSLAFISYPEAIAKFETVPWLFALLFFGMLFVLGIGSLVAIHCCANTVIMDSFPQLKTWQVSGMTAIVGFLVGLVYVTPGGQFILTLVDYFGGTFIIFILTIVEIVSVVWIYGLGNICDDIEFMVKTKVGIYWRIMWGMVTPALLIVIFIYFLATLTRLKYGPYDYPNSTLAFGWLFFAIAMLQFIVWMFYYICKNRNYGFPEMIRKAFSSDNWRPKGVKDYEDWKKFKEEKNHQKFGQSTARRKLNLIIGIPNKHIYQK